MPVLLSALLMIPSIQYRIANYVAQLLSEKYQTTITISHFYFTPISKIELDDLTVYDQQNDTLLYIKKFNATMDIWTFGPRYFEFNQISILNPIINLNKENNIANFDFLLSSDTIKTASKISTRPKNIQIIDGMVNWQNDDSTVLFKKINIDKLNLSINKMFNNADSASFILSQLSLNEQSGFKIKQATTKIQIGKSGLIISAFKLVTDSSSIQIDSIQANYKSIEELKQLSDSIQFNVKISPSTLHPFDVNFIPNKGSLMKFPFTFSGEFSGSLSNLRGKNTRLSFGKSTHIYSSFKVIGLPKIDETFLFLNIADLETNSYDISTAINKLSNSNYTINNQTLAYLGNVNFSGNITGFFNDLVTYGKLRTDLGTINTDIGLKIDERITFSGNIRTVQFDIGKLLRIESDLGKISMKMSINGSHQSSTDYFAYLKGSIDSINIKNYQYRNIDLNGLFTNQKFDGQFTLNDPNLQMDFTGNIDLSRSIPNFIFFASLQNMKLDKLNIAPNLPNTELSFNVISNFEGSRLNDLRGFLRLEDALFRNDSKSFHLDSMIIQARKHEDKKQITIDSELFDLELTGNYDFSHFSANLSTFMAHFMPVLFPPIKPTETPTDNSFSFIIDLKKLGSLINIINPTIELSNSGIISGQFNSNAKYLEIEGEIPYFKHPVVKGHNLHFNIKGDEELSTLIQLDSLHLLNSIDLKNVAIQQKIKQDEATTNMFWNNLSNLSNEGSIFTKTKFEKNDSLVDANIQFEPSNMIVNDLVWNIKPTRLVINKNSISADNFRIWHENQQITIDGSINRYGNDGLNGYIRNIDISKILKDIANIDVSGVLNAEFQAKNLFATPSIIGDISIDDLMFNNELLGQFNTTSQWSADKNALVINTNITHQGKEKLKGSGFYFTQDHRLDLEADLNDLSISFLNLYLKSILQNVRGQASGKMKLKGELTNPILTGNVKIEDGAFDVDFLKISYKIADSVILEPHKMIFKNMTLRDKFNHTGRANGYISHQSFSNFKYNLNIDINNCLTLDTKEKDNPLYYGTVFTTGAIKITGATNQIKIDIQAKTMPNTKLFIPLQDTREATQNNFINFSNNNNTEDASTIHPNYKVDLSGVEMAMEIDINPNASVQIIFDPRTGEKLSGVGNGDIQLKIDKYANFSMFGNFNFDYGDYMFSLQNIINKRFYINKGSQLRWDGQPYDATININATYKTKASLYDLMAATADQTQSSDLRKRIPINCNMVLTERLIKPEIKFGIESAENDQNANNIIKSYINSDEELNRQVLSLMVFNKFYTSETQKTNSANDSRSNYTSAISTTTNLLSNQLSSWLSQNNNEIDVGLNYRPGDQITNQEIDVALTKQLFDNRVTLRGNFGYVDYQTQSDASNFIGDFDLDVKLNSTGTIRAHAYTHTNNDIMYSTASPTKQGVGVSFRNEFDTWGEFLQKYWAIITRNETDSIKKKKQTK